MKALYDELSEVCSKKLTERYSTSFSAACRMLHKSIRKDVYNIYGFVRLGDEIVDTFHDYDKEALFACFKKEVYRALDDKISLNPLLNAFQKTVHAYAIDRAFIDAFLHSMELDLVKRQYKSREEYEAYIYGSADVVGLMCLQVFVKGDPHAFKRLEQPARRLGSAFQKVNFMRDLRDDTGRLQRSYFPDLQVKTLDEPTKKKLVHEIEEDFKAAYPGVQALPKEARLATLVAYHYYRRLLRKLAATPAKEIRNKRIRVADWEKMWILAYRYVKFVMISR